VRVDSGAVVSIFRRSRPPARPAGASFFAACAYRPAHGPGRRRLFEARPMYAVIKTGGKQYRVQAGDVLVVEKLDGEAGAAVAFGEVLMLGEGEAVTVGAPTVDGAVVSGTLLETRK